MERVRKSVYWLHPWVLSWLSTLLLLAQMILSLFFGVRNPDGLQAIQYTGHLAWALSAVFGVLLIITFRMRGRVEKGKNYVHTTKLVDSGIYAIVWHPQYLAGVLISLALILMTQHWLIALLGVPAMVLIWRELRVYQQAFEAATSIYELLKGWPKEERYSLTDQIRRSSRSVCANVAEAWRKRRYRSHFVSKLSDADAEAAETRVWLEFALKCRYMAQEEYESLGATYHKTAAGLVGMMANADSWCGPSKLREASTQYDADSSHTSHTSPTPIHLYPQSAA